MRKERLLSLVFVILLLFNSVPLVVINKAQATSPIAVGLPCAKNPNLSLDTINSSYRNHIAIGGDNHHATSVDLQNGEECSGNDVIASVSGSISVYTRDDTPYCKYPDGSYIKNPAINTVIEITRSDGIKVVYYHHNQDYTATVSDGYVNAGEKLATIGEQGCATGPHIHFEVRSSSNVKLPYDQWEFGAVSFPNSGNWETSGIGMGEVRFAEFNGKMYESVRGTDQSINTRYFDGSNWSNWTVSGIGGSAINMQAFQNRLYQTVLGTNGAIYTRSTDGANWTSWESSGLGASEITMTVLKAPSPSTQRWLWQAVRGTNDVVYVRNMDQNATTWSSWTSLPVPSGATFSPTIQAYNGKVYVSVVGKDQGIYTAYWQGGLWSGWTHSGIAWGKVNMEVHNNGTVLYQTVSGTNEVVNTRSFNGSTWTGWEASMPNVGSFINLESVSGRLYQSVKTKDSNINTRYLENGNWSAWQSSGIGSTEIGMGTMSGKLFQGVIGTDQKIYTRYF